MKHLKPFNESKDKALFFNKHFMNIFYESQDVLGATITTDYNERYYFISLNYPENEQSIFQTHSLDTVDSQLVSLETLKDVILASKKILQKLEAEHYIATYKIDGGDKYSTTFWIERNDI